MSPESKPAAINVQTLLKETETKMQKALEVVQREFNTLRTGRATPSLVEGLRVDYFGTPTPLKQLAGISASDPKMLVIQPWDANSVQEIEKALQKSDLGLTPIVEGKVIRVPVPPLSTERRDELTKIAHRQAEEGRVAVRNIRHGAKDGIEKMLKDKEITEDEKFKNLDLLQKLTDRTQKKVDEILAGKEAELKIV